MAPNSGSKLHSGHDLAVLRRLRDYINQQTNLTNKGVKHALASDAWYLPAVDVQGVIVWAAISDDYSTFFIATLSPLITDSLDVSSCEMRMESWSLNGAKPPRLEKQETRTYSHSIYQSIRYRMGHIDVEAPAPDQAQERAEESTLMARDIASFLSKTSSYSASFSAILSGNHWEELVVRDGVVMLSRRRGPRGPQYRVNEQGSESVISDLFEHSSEPEAGSNLSLSEDDPDEGSGSEDGFRISDIESNEGDAPLSPTAYSEEGPDGDVVVDYENWDRDDGESLQSLHLDSDSEPEKALTDPDEEIPHGPHSGALDTCNICRRETICLLHCHICGGRPFSICKRCWEQGSWCHDDTHKMADCPYPACPTAKRITAREPDTELELVIFNDASDLGIPTYQFTQAHGLLTPPSPPSIHPTAPVVAWFLGGNQILFLNYETQCHFVYRDPGWYHEGMSSAGIPKTLLC